MDFLNIKKETSPKWFIAAFTVARITMGAFFSITGPTLPILASNMDVSLAVAQTAISIRSIAVMVGSLIPDLVFSKVSPMLFLACAITINGVALALIPTFTNIIIFNVCITVTGFTFGIVDMGLQSLILKYWGSEKSRGLIQLFHGTFAVGALLAPLLCKVFITAETSETLPASCMANITFQETTQPPAASVATTTMAAETAQLMTPYLICGVAVFVVGLFFFYLNWQKLLDGLEQNNQDIVDNRPEEPLSPPLFGFFMCIFLFYFGSQSVEVLFNSQVYIFARCSDFSMSEANNIYITYWLSFMTSRCLAVYLARIIKPVVYLAVSISVGIGACLVLLTGRLWLATVMVGFTIAIYYPSGISFSSQWTKMSGKYIGVFGVGCTSGAMIPPLINGFLMEKDYQYYLLSVIISQAVCVISFAGIWLLGKHILSNSRLPNSDSVENKPLSSNE